jgi:hypothetical protein
VAVLLVLGGACPALATPNNEVNGKRLDGTVRFLENAQNSDGGFGAEGRAGEPSDAEFTAWVAIALASAGINPENQARPAGESAYGYLADHAGELASTTDFERVLLVVDAAGTSPHDFGGVDLPRAILQRQLPEGGFFHEEGHRTPAINDTAFAILALSPVAEAPVQEAVANAAKWLEREQNADGSWPSGCPKSTPSCGNEMSGEVDMTAAAVEALNAAGLHDTEAQRRALEYLRGAQNTDGGFPEYPGVAESNAASSAWTVQAIWSAGENPETWTQHSSGKEPLGYLESMQHENGSIQWEASSDEDTVRMTAYAAPAFSGESLPLAAVPLEVPGSTPPVGGGGVTAGGGGDGAPLFSRPQPQSQGRTPGGARQLKRPRGRRARTTRAPREPELKHREPALAIASPTAAATTTTAAKRARSAPHGRGRATEGASSTPTVTGLLIDASDDTPIENARESGAPGLRSASPDANASRWLAIGLGGLIALLLLAGALLERRRPQVIL